MHSCAVALDIRDSSIVDHDVLKTDKRIPSFSLPLLPSISSSVPMTSMIVAAIDIDESFSQMLLAKIPDVTDSPTENCQP
jgi:hypothetical protein